MPELRAELLFTLGVLLHEHVHVTSTPRQKMGQAKPHLPAKGCAVKKRVPAIVFQGTCQICVVYNHVSLPVGKAALSLLRDPAGALLPHMETLASLFQQLPCCKQMQ